jgi:hypothetical protein
VKFIPVVRLYDCTIRVRLVVFVWFFFHLCTNCVQSMYATQKLKIICRKFFWLLLILRNTPQNQVLGINTFVKSDCVFIIDINLYTFVHIYFIKDFYKKFFLFEKIFLFKNFSIFDFFIKLSYLLSLIFYSAIYSCFYLYFLQNIYMQIKF